MVVTDLADFLRARYAEDAQSIRANWHRDGITSERYHGTAIDPTHLLADLDAKLAIVDAYAPKTPGPRTDAELHADEEHPAWEYRSMEGTWTPQDGWESNVDLNGGYEVTGYTELSYWRRRLPAGQERQPRPEPLVLRLLARPFAGHPDYQEDWAA